ncbi:TPA: DUF3850 domain-containing protein [Klebsiella michiganensis]
MTNSKLIREPISHELKIFPEFFSAVCTGVKRAELRKNDSDYRVGDTLHLLETPRGSCHSTGEFINATITHIADVGEWMPGYVLLSIEREAMDRKAAMDSEPVAWKIHTPETGVTYVETNPQSVDNIRNGYGIKVEITPLYRHAQPAPVDPISFDEWSRKCALQITLCYPDFREKAQYIWDSARSTLLQELQKSAGVSNNCRTNENVQVLKDHQIRELVNQLRDIAIKYHAAGQLREQIARVVRAAMLQVRG